MRVFMALVRRELAGAFNALSGWVVMAATALLTGISIVDMVTKLSDRPTDSPVTELFYQSAYFWVILLVVSPVITMRTFAAEKSSGTYEALMTTPVGDWQVVLAKYTGSMLFFGLVWLPLLGVLLILRQVTGEAGLLDPGATAGAFLGVMLIGSVYMALGCFASSMTRSQIIAAMVSFLLGIGLWIVSLRPVSTNVGEGRWVRLLDELSLLRHMDDFARGILDSRHIVFHLTVTFLFLFLTQRVVESRRWK